jgi:hypothetical protein
MRLGGRGRRGDHVTRISVPYARRARSLARAMSRRLRPVLTTFDQRVRTDFHLTRRCSRSAAGGHARVLRVQPESAAWAWRGRRWRVRGGRDPATRASVVAASALRARAGRRLRRRWRGRPSRIIGA